jgi:hypothetical protein
VIPSTWHAVRATRPVLCRLTTFGYGRPSGAANADSAPEHARSPPVVRWRHDPDRIRISRLSRTDKDWCRLLEVCQIFGTLIADEQQVYDLNYLDDQTGPWH